MKKIITIFILTLLFLQGVVANAASNKINTKKDFAVCNKIKTNYKSEIMFNWSNGNAKNEDVLKEIDDNIKILSIKQKNISKEINKVIKKWILAEKNTKDALIQQDVEKIIKATNLKISSLNKFNTICNSIGKQK